MADSVKTNTQAGIITQFNDLFVATEKIKMESTFEDFVYQIKKQHPTEGFAKHYIGNAEAFLTKVKAFRETQLLQSV